MIYFDPIEFINNRLKGVNIRFYNNDITKNVKSFDISNRKIIFTNGKVTDLLSRKYIKEVREYES